MMTIAIIKKRRDQNILIEHNEYIDFSSNDYLGMAQSKQLMDHMKDAVDAYGMGATGSRRLSGNHQVMRETEEVYSKWLQKDGAVLFNSGFQMNVGLFKALFKKNTTIIADKLIHASLIDGILGSGCNLLRFNHNNMHQLEVCLKKAPKNTPCVIVCEALYSMDGDTPNLDTLIRLKKQYGAQLMLDEAHSIGLYGPNGQGLAYSQGVIKDIDYLLITFGKAFGLSGGMFLANQQHIDTLRGMCRSYIYSTALPLPIVSTIGYACSVITDAHTQRNALFNNIKTFNQLCNVPGHPLYNSPIQALIIGDKEPTTEHHLQLLKNGMYVRPIHHPTVPKGASRLRITLTAQHTPENIKKVTGYLATHCNPSEGAL